MSKKLLSTLALAGLVALSLAACSSGPSDADCAVTPSGSSSAKIDVSGKFNVAPKVKFPTPLTAKTTERSVITAGKGKPAEKGSILSVNYTAYNATTGKKIDESPYTTDAMASFPLDSSLVTGLVKATECSTPGTRIAAIIPPVDAFADAGNETLGVSATDSMIFIIDVVEVKAAPKPSPSGNAPDALPKANGTDEEPVAGLPTVTLADNGAPTITIPATDAPAELQLANLKTGDGPVVGDGDTVTVHYTGVIWASGETFDSSWDRGEPTSFPTSGVIPGFQKALVGQNVGSQVLVVIPPAEGYGEAGNGSIKGTDTIVFVVDILGTQK